MALRFLRTTCTYWLLGGTSGDQPAEVGSDGWMDALRFLGRARATLMMHIYIPQRLDVYAYAIWG